MSQPGQRWDPERYARTARFVADHGAPVLDLLAPQAGERVLDLGCGDGALTEQLAGMVASVVGVDASAEQIEAAKARGLEALAVSGEELAFDAEFDAVFSNAALHWMKRPERVIDGVWRALRPGGRFVGEMGGAENVVSVRRALHAALTGRGVDADALDPWFFPDEAEYAGLLEARGFEVLSIERFARPTPIPGPLEDWLDTFGETFLLALPELERGPVKTGIAAELRDRLSDGRGNWTLDYVRLRFAARKPD